MKYLTMAFFVISMNGFGQTANEFFNKAANEYIYQGDEVALNTIGAGLSIHPNDQPLTNLKEKIEKEKEQQEQKQNQEQEQQEQQEQQEEQEEQQNQEQQEQQNQEQEQQEQEESDDAEKKDQSEQAQEQETEEEGEEMEQPPQSRSEKLEELNLTEEKARMILEAMKNNEIQYIQQNKRKATKKPDSNKPDW
jgi:hypothetical protein